ncbi:hypothetical protein GCM10007860_22970 [Chitiniphilus shinanonensis]|uniref:MFS transporter n=1 Tax=Chitiniphilus shinanonensis TaxID=553088 RepID=A0ABQ6BUW0_9NEIS|nr:hypothetical protein [Chitiniphilus shinanonensis]GLS05147.1 hypothetical protein GCM10007860_22970 [Chitiniphilus shinanonensis]
MNADKRRLLSFYAMVTLFTGVDMGLMIGLFWSSLKITGSPLALGLVLCLSVLLPFSLQRLARRLGKTLMLDFQHTLVMRAAGFVLVLGCALAGLFHGLYGFVLIALLVGVLGFFTTSALEAVNTCFSLARVVSSEASARWMQTAIQLGAFGGAALGGLVLEGLGIDRFALVFCSAGCLAALAVLVSPLGRLHAERVAGAAMPAPRAGGMEQVQGVDGRLLRALCLGLGMIGFHIGAFNTLTPVIYQSLNHWTAADFGLASGVAGVGAFLAAVLPSARVPDYVPPLLILLMDAVLVYAGVAAVSIGACFLIGYSINHLRIQLRRKLIELARSPADADRIASISAFYYLLMQSAAPLILAGLITERLFGRQAAPEVFVLVAAGLLLSVLVLPRLGGAPVRAVAEPG